MQKTKTVKVVGLSVADWFTLSRIFGAAWLIFIKPMSSLFFIVYSVCGISDVIDGWIARATKTTSEIGARLDSMGDIFFYGVMLIRVFPILWGMLPSFIWYIVCSIILIRIVSYLLAAIKYKCFASLHTLLNKLTGFCMFAVPYLLQTKFGVEYCFIVMAVAGISSMEELIIHILRKEYSLEGNSIFKMGKKA